MLYYEIPATTIRAALCCASKGDVRYYLNAVLLEPAKGRAVSTDGHMMFIGEAPKSEFPTLLVPRDLLDQVMKHLGRKGILRTNLAFRDDPEQAGRFILHTPDATFPFAAVDGTFPEYERVIPPKTSGKVSQFDPDLVVTARDALAWYSGKDKIRGFTLQHNGDGPAIYSDDGITAFCIVMPLRVGEPGNQNWYYGRKAA